MQSHGDPSKDQPPKPPEGVYTKSEQPRYSQMMASLVDQVKSDVGEQPEDWYRSYMKGIEGHHTKVQDLQEELQEKLAELEKEEGKKITSDSIHTGFDKSSVSKEQEKPKPATKPKAEAVEVLNHGSLNKKKLIRSDSAQSSGADADVDEPTADAEENHDDDVEASPLGKEFAKIKPGDYKACLDFISQHREVVAEKETDGLLIEGFNAQMDGKAAYAKQCVHQALLLQYCRTLGRDGVGLFFKRYSFPPPHPPLKPSQSTHTNPKPHSITTPNHQAQKVFLDDVTSTYTRIRTRTAELTRERAANPPSSSDPVEQIQLHAVDPGTQIHINIPQPSSSDAVEISARAIFEAFPPGLQRALESGQLEEVNEVLGRMSVEEAEEVVERLGEGGMLSLEEGVIDGTTEEGRERLKALEKEAERGREVEEVEEGVGEIEVAGPD